VATSKTPAQALGIALKKAASDAPEDILAALPDNCLLITDVDAFRTVLQAALDSSVADLGPKVDAARLPKQLQTRIRERLEDLEA